MRETSVRSQETEVRRNKEEPLRLLFVLVSLFLSL
jgi:hypothetical protein